MHPKLISIGDFFLPTYGVLVAAAFLTALWLAARLARKSGLNADFVTSLGVYCALAGMAGAKLTLILFEFGYYVRRPAEIFSLSTLRAGGVFQGGVVLALVVAVLYLRRHKLPFLRTADAFAPALALGHAIGRLGCFSAGCCWGTECDRPWSVTFTNPESHQLVGVPLGTPLHPTQLYEAGAEALIFVFLYRAFHRPHKEGGVIGLYLVLYSAARFVVEFFRHHEQPTPMGGPLSLGQWMSIVTLALGVWLVLRRSEPAGAVPSSPSK